MTQTRRPDPYDSPRTFYGAELRRLREEAELTRDQLGERVFCSTAYIAAFEWGLRRPQEEISQLMDGIFGTGEHLQRLCRLARRSKHSDYFADAAELEKEAEKLCDHAPLLVPGLLQTADYTRAVSRATTPFIQEEVIEGYVQARLERQRLLKDQSGPELWTILHETVLRTPFGGPEAMARQLDHIADLARSHRVLTQVLPHSAAADGFVNGMMRIMTFAEGPTVVYLEGAYHGQLIDDPTLVAQCQSAYDLVRAAALSPTASLAMLDSVAEDYRNR